MKLSKNRYTDIAAIILCCLCAYVVIWSFTGEWPNSVNPYNSYILQAKAWLSGRLDLGRNYEHLELAVFKGKYFVSFPPLPSVILLPFAILGIPDNAASVFVSCTACIYAYKLCSSFGKNDSALFLSLFLCIASNVLLVSINSWVWFIAQNLSFLFTIMGFYYAKEKKGIPSLAFLSLAVLCRPFQILYFPILALILSDGKREKNAWHWFVIPVILGISCMIFNYVRFGNPLEFGHNYLPEFTSCENGQFDISYIAENAKSLVRLPKFASDGKLIFPEFNGMCIFLCSPIIIFCLIFSLSKINRIRILTGILTVSFHILLLLAHKTMGGWHFGNRYFIDILPCLFYMMLYSFPANERGVKKIMLPFFIFGLCLNVVGIVEMLK